MSDAELDAVTGGTVDETMRDSWFLNSLNGSCERHADFGVVLDMASEEITNAWSTVGVRAEINSFGFRSYAGTGTTARNELCRQANERIRLEFVICLIVSA